MKISEMTWPKRYGQRFIALAAVITVIGFVMAIPTVMLVRDISFTAAFFQFLLLGVPGVVIGAVLSAMAVTPGKNVWKRQWPEPGK